MLKQDLAVKVSTRVSYVDSCTALGSMRSANISVSLIHKPTVWTMLACVSLSEHLSRAHAYNVTRRGRERGTVS